MTDLKSADEVGGIAPRAAQPQIRTIRPVLFWSAVGAVCIAFATYVYTSWIVSGNAAPVAPGPDPIPGGTQVAIIAFQIACPLLALGAIVYVVRKCLRERQLCIEAAVVIGSTIAWWHDPLINWFQPVLFYNAGLVNFGNWMENVPGSLSPGSRFMAEPVLMIGMIYIWMPLAMGSLARWAMGRARRRWPALGPVRTFCCGWLAVYVIEFPLEIFAVHHGLVAYPASIPSVTLWAGQTVQIPLYGPILWSLVLSTSGALMFFRNRKGQIRVESGIETLHWAGPKLKGLLRVLAVAGFMHVIAIGVYDVPVNIAGLYAGPTDTYPSYLRTQYCGPDTPRRCPDGTLFDDR
ncbi:spirocyclase AveC family protein [Mycolicibacterium gilvum]|uniref:Postpolyketide modification protein n=1 Tax=Mycolicibacterium gilvum TaxID=1804 RepID=A0A378SUI2_9MYCO|nr:spirocyclase AveC family protein [Mycolicibacterium gilvum]MCV7057486.1 spirocyclase AveC family protein [Mycolicibacterium gilvum]STZ46423.1 postpolyketide modification protein [Mycolicibacterium gilvum]